MKQVIDWFEFAKSTLRLIGVVSRSHVRRGVADGFDRLARAMGRLSW